MQETIFQISKGKKLSDFEKFINGQKMCYTLVKVVTIKHY